MCQNWPDLTKNGLKEEWHRLRGRAKVGCGKAQFDKPAWFKLPDPIFSETHSELKIDTKGDDILSDESNEDSGADSPSQDEEELKEQRKFDTSGSSLDTDLDETEASNNLR